MCRSARRRAWHCQHASVSKSSTLLMYLTGIWSAAEHDGVVSSVAWKSAIIGACNSHPANLALGRKQLERCKERSVCQQSINVVTLSANHPTMKPC